MYHYPWTLNRTIKNNFICESPNTYVTTVTHTPRRENCRVNFKAPSRVHVRSWRVHWCVEVLRSGTTWEPCCTAAALSASDLHPGPGSPCFHQHQGLSASASRCRLDWHDWHVPSPPSGAMSVAPNCWRRVIPSLSPVCSFTWGTVCTFRYLLSAAAYSQLLWWPWGCTSQSTQSKGCDWQNSSCLLWKSQQGLCEAVPCMGRPSQGLSVARVGR